MKHLLSLLEYNESEFVKLLELAEKIKGDWVKGKRPDLLPRKVLGLIFEKPSLRTRVSFEAAMMQMGGNSIFLGTADGKIGVRETVADFARTICGSTRQVRIQDGRKTTPEIVPTIS